MSGYHNIIMPDEFSQGSTFSIGYDTRITTLESGIEDRMARYAPQGRRRYSVLKGIANTTDVQTLYQFFVLRSGALNSFKFKDWQDYATTLTRTTHLTGEAPDWNDMVMTLVSGRTYQMVTIYQDSAQTVVRTLKKIKPGTERIGKNGSETFAFTIDYETGIVIFTGVDVITSATSGCEFYTVVRFADNTDESFNVAIQSSFTASSIPGFELIEDIDPATVSQHVQYGGSYSQTLTGDINLTEVNGRVQNFITSVAAIDLKLPASIDIPEGGPIFVIHNDIGSTETFDIVNQLGTPIVSALAANKGAMIFLAELAGVKFWFALVGN